MKSGLFAATSLLLTCFASPALAVDKLYTPYVDHQEWELEYFGRRTVDNDSGKDNAQKHELALGYGVTPYWKTELYGIFEKDPHDDIKFDAWEWENIFQLTERGEYWMDVGVALAYEWTPQSNHADALEAKLLLAKDYYNTFHVFNGTLEKEIGSGPRDNLEGELLWSSRYRYSPYFEPGFEISSEFGELNHTGSFDDQSHALGPVAYGKLLVPITDKGEALKYRVGYLFGISDGAPDGQLVAQLEYELEF